MVTGFDADTALARVDRETYEGHISEAWWVGRGPNGGYVAAIILRALHLTLADPASHLGDPAQAGTLRQPRSFTIHYLEPPAVGPCRVSVVVERAGRSLTTLSARLTQEGRTCAIAIAALAMPKASFSYTDAVQPEAPPLEETVRLPRWEGGPAFAGQYDYHWAIGDPPFSGSRHARVGGWIRLAEPRIADDLLVAAYSDAWMPSLFPVVREPLAAPTIDLTIHFRADLPLPETQPEDYYLAVFSSRLAGGGVFEEDGEVWSRGGVLLAQSRQLATLPTLRR